MGQKSKGVRYKQPSSVNFVSFLLGVLILGGIYWAYCFGPAYLKNFQVKQLVHEAASRYFKLSHLDKAVRAQETNKVLDETRGKIVEVLGFNDPQLVVQMRINEETKKVNVVAEYNHTVQLLGTDKTRVIHFTTLAESDYLPNDW